MFSSLLEQLFTGPGEQAGGIAAGGDNDRSCHGGLEAAVEHVVDELYGRLRFVPNYVQLLREPVAATLRHIDEVAESIPGPVLCSRSTFQEDPKVNAFFVNPQHLQEVFSHSEEVRSLFESRPLADDCWGLLCMHMRESTQPGMALVDGKLRKDVMQTSISFGDHQIVSPGADEPSARCALKCCMFNALLAHVRQAAAASKSRSQELQGRLQALKARQRRVRQQAEPDGGGIGLERQIADLEQQLLSNELRLDTINAHLDYVVSVLSNPAAFIGSEQCSLRINRQSVKLEPGSADEGYDLELSRIRVASQGPRIGALVRFRRDELLPKPDMLKQADLFLTV